MAECKYAKQCHFMKESSNFVSRQYKQQYCYSEDHTHCGRFLIAETVGQENVPTYIYPNMKIEARAILSRLRG